MKKLTQKITPKWYILYIGVWNQAHFFCCCWIDTNYWRMSNACQNEIFWWLAYVLLVCFFRFNSLAFFHLELGEILSIKNRDDEQLFYIHYSDCNKRLDEWVSQDRLDLKHVQYPKRETKGSMKNGSRQSSPDRETSSVIFFWNNFW